MTWVAIIGAGLMIVGALIAIPAAWRSRYTSSGALRIAFIVVATAAGTSVIVYQTGLMRGDSYHTLTAILLLLFVGVRASMFLSRKR